MRILLITPHFYPENFKTNDLALSLKAEGHEVLVLTGQPHYPAGRIFKGYTFWRRLNDTYEGIRVVRCPIQPRYAGKAWQLALNYISYAISTTLFGLPRVIFWRPQITLIFASSPITVAIPGLVLRKFRKVPVTLWIQDLWPESVRSVKMVGDGWVMRILRAVVRFIYTRCDLILMQSEKFRESVLRHGARESGVAVLHNWTDVHFSPIRDVVSQRAGDTFEILYAGNMGHAQGLDSVIRAAEITQATCEPALNWHFLGDGPVKAHFENLARERGLKNIKFSASVPAAEMSSFYDQADALLLPLADEEAFWAVLPSKTQSYLAVGRPILAHACGSVAELIAETDTGLISHPGDAEALAANAVKISRWSSDRKREVSRNGLTAIEQRFSRASGIRSLVQNLERVLS